MDASPPGGGTAASRVKTCAPAMRLGTGSKREGINPFFPLRPLSFSPVHPTGRTEHGPYRERRNVVCKAPAPIQQHIADFKRVSLEVSDGNSWHASKFKVLASTKDAVRAGLRWLSQARMVVSQNHNRCVFYVATLNCVPHLNGG